MRHQNRPARAGQRAVFGYYVQTAHVTLILNGIAVAACGIAIAVVFAL